MNEISGAGLVPTILALQFIAFGWRVNREIPVGDAGRKTWFPVPDVLNILSMLSVVAFCIIVPISAGVFSGISSIVLAIAFVLIAFHPIAMAAHYRLFSKQGRQIYTARKQDYPYCTVSEAIVVFCAFLFAAMAAWYVA